MKKVLVLVIVATLAACSPKGEKLLARAEASLAGGEYRAAMIDLQNYLSAHPDDAAARARLGITLLELGDTRGAEVEIRKARDLGAGADLLRLPECRLLATRSEYEQILEDCAADTGKAEVDGEINVVRGEALLGLGRNDEAVETFRAAVGVQPDRVAPYQGLALATFATAGIEQARAVLESAPAAVKDQPRYWMVLGGLELRAGNTEACERAFVTAVERTAKGEADSPDRLAALAGLTEVQLRKGDTKAADETSQTLITAAPNAPLAKVLRAQSLAASGDLGQARTLLEEVVSRYPDHSDARILLGMVNFQQGNLGQAEMHLSNVVAREPDNIRAQRLLAEIRGRLRPPEETLEALKPALAGGAGADPSLLTLASQLSLQSGDRAGALAYLSQAGASAVGATPEAQLEVAGGYLMAGEFDRAIELLEAMPAGEGDAAVRRETLLMMALFRQGRTSEALARADAMVAKSPDSSAARSLAAAAYVAAGKTQEARTQFEAIAKLKPDDAGAQINLARIDLAEGKADDAARRFEQVLAKDGKNLIATVGMSAVATVRKDAKEAERWLLKATSDHPESVEARLALAHYYLGKRDFGQGRQAAEEATKLAPQNAAAFNLRGLAQLGGGDLPAALASFAEATRLAPQAQGYRLNMARAYALQQEPEKALGVVDAALKDSDDPVPALGLGAVMALKFGKVERAAGYVERLRTAAPQSPVLPRLEGDLAMAQKRYKDAVADYARTPAAARDTSLALAQYQARRLAGVGNPQGTLEEWLVQHPQDVAVRVALAEYWQERGDTSRARAQYEQGLKQAPNDTVILNNLAVIYQKGGDARALETAERAYRSAPDVPAIKDTYGWLLVEQGEVDKGLPLLRDAAKALPGLDEVQYHLGAALAKKGEVTEARRILETVASGQGPDDIRAQAKLALKNLDK